MYIHVKFIKSVQYIPVIQRFELILGGLRILCFVSLPIHALVCGESIGTPNIACKFIVLHVRLIALFDNRFCGNRNIFLSYNGHDPY